MWQRSTREPTAYDDDWEGQPGQGPFYQWGLGLAVPIVILGYGIHAIVTRQAEWGGRTTMTLHGLNAVASGVAAVSAAVFLHCHYFWGNLYDQAWFAVLGKILGACGFIAGLGTVIVRVGVFGVG